MEQDDEVSILRGRLQDALGNLTPLDREIVLLSAWEHLSQAEIGEAVGLNARAVSSRLYRARRQLGHSIQNRDISADPDTTRTTDSAITDDETGKGRRS